MGQFEKDLIVISIKQRMLQNGIDMDRYIGVITNTWHENPAGFGFTCVERTDGNPLVTFHNLTAALIANSHFGVDNMIGGSQHHGMSYRENNQPDSLHVVISKRADPKMAGATCSIHVDSVSPVAGIDSQGGIIYDMGKILQHAATDLKHTPLIMPHAENGTISFGFRFGH